MIDILAFLLQTYSHDTHYPGDKDLARELDKAGFADSQIRQTLAWQKRLQQARDQQHTPRPSPNSVRILSAQEQYVLDTRCINFMIMLEKSGNLSASTREFILEHIASLEPETLSLARFKILVLFALWQTEEEADTLIMSDLLQEFELQQYNPEHDDTSYYTCH